MKRREVYEYLDGRLRPDRRAALEERAATDAELARELTEAERVRALLRALPLEPAPATLARAVMAQVRQQPVPQRRSAFAQALQNCLRPQRLALATCAVAVLVGFGQVRVGHGRDPATLSATDEAFVRECLRDYHREAAVHLVGDDGSRSSDAVQRGTVEF